MIVITAPAGYKEYTVSDYYDGIVVEGVTYRNSTEFYHKVVSRWADRNKWKLDREEAEREEAHRERYGEMEDVNEGTYYKGIVVDGVTYDHPTTFYHSVTVYNKTAKSCEFPDLYKRSMKKYSKKLLASSGKEREELIKNKDNLIRDGYWEKATPRKMSQCPQCVYEDSLKSVAAGARVAVVIIFLGMVLFFVRAITGWW